MTANRDKLPQIQIGDIVTIEDADMIFHAVVENIDDDELELSHYDYEHGLTKRLSEIKSVYREVLE